MEIRAAEISDIIKRQIAEYEREVEVRETGRVLSSRRRHRPHLRPRQGRRRRAARVPARHLRHGAQPRRGQRRRRDLRRGARDRGRRRGPAHRPHRRGAGRRGAARPRRRRARPADRRQGPDRRHRDPPHRAQGARHRRAPAGEGAAADRHQGHRRDDPDRPRPARADHRRPPDRQDRRRHRHDHQPEGRRRASASTSPSARSARPSRRSSRSSTRHGAMDYTIVVAATASDAAPLQFIAALHRLRDGRVLPRQRPARAGDLRRSLQAGRRLPPAVAAAAPPAGPRGLSRATSSTCTPACSSAPRR